RAAVVAVLVELGCLAERDQGADRYASPEALRHRDGVGQDVMLPEGEPGTGARDPGLDLVNDEQGAVLAGQFSCPLNEPGRKVDHAGLPLDRLEDQGGDGFVDGG